MSHHRAHPAARRGWPRRWLVALLAAVTVTVAAPDYLADGTAPAPRGYTIAAGVPAPAPTAPRADAGCLRFCLPDRPHPSGGVSTNGWDTHPVIVARPVPGTAAVLTVRDGPAGDLLIAVALRWDRLVEGLDAPIPDDWGANDRHVRGEPGLTSDHASATAIDLNSLCHGLAVPVAATFTAAELEQVRDLVAQTRGVIEWGGDWGGDGGGRADGMHLALAPGTTDAQASAALQALGGVAPLWLVALPSRAPCRAS